MIAGDSPGMTAFADEPPLNLIANYAGLTLRFAGGYTDTVHTALLLEFLEVKDMGSENGLSRRVQENLLPSPLFEGIKRAFTNAYEPLSKPDGIISLGIAENIPMYSDLAAFLDKNLKITPNLLGYGAVNPGPPGLMSALVKLYNSDPFNSVIPVEEEHIYFTAGCTALLDQLFWNFCDEGEGVLIGKPLYGGFANDLKSRAKAKLLAVSLKGLDVFSKEAVKRYEEALLEAEKEGIKTKVLVLCTPHNPLGQYPP